MSITTKAALLSYAEIQMRSKGYSAFSYADLAAKVGIRKSSIHHHFPLSMLEGASLIDWTLGRSADPLAGFNHLLEMAAMQSSLLRAG